MNIEEIIVKVLESYVIDEIGETRPFIDPDLKKDIATDIISIIKSKNIKL